MEYLYLAFKIFEIFLNTKY